MRLRENRKKRIIAILTTFNVMEKNERIIYKILYIHVLP